MTKIVTALFERTSDGRATVAGLEAIGVPPGEISFISNQRDDAPATAEVAEDAGTGAGIVALPGIGPVVAGGWLVATAIGAATGAAVGGAAGGIVGALAETGEADGSTGFYADGLRNGGTVVSVRIDEALLSQAADIFARNRAVDGGAMPMAQPRMPVGALPRDGALVNHGIFEGRRAA
jgi:hypothetical protein